jgi:hypothetical protein
VQETADRSYENITIFGIFGYILEELKNTCECIQYFYLAVTETDQIKKTEMGRACSTYGGRVCRGFWWGNLREGAT